MASEPVLLRWRRDLEAVRESLTMPSRAFKAWRTDAKAVRDHFENLHTVLTGGGPVGKDVTKALSGAYVMALASHFQKFCRDLHSEASQHLVAGAPVAYQALFRLALTNGRMLKKGNASEESLGSDFNRFGFDFLGVLDAANPRNKARRLKLRQLNIWRNAVAHQDFDFSVQQQQQIKGTQLNLTSVRGWMSACEALTRQFDQLVAVQVRGVAGKAPWK